MYKMCAVKTLPCLRENKHAYKWGSWIEAVKAGCVSKIWESSEACFFVGELWRWVSVCAHLHVLQHSSVYDLHQFCCSACSCQQLHLLLFCQAEQILESGMLSVLAAGNASSLPKLFPRLQAELRDGALDSPWVLLPACSSGNRHLLSPLVSSTFLSLGFYNLISTCITKFGTLR